MGWFDSFDGFVDKATSFVDKNKNWLEPVVNLGTSLFNQSSENSATSQYLDYLRQKEQQNYNDSVATYNAQMDYQKQLAAAHGANSAAARAASAARANAARQTEANRQRAAKKANKFEQNMYKELLGYYQPFKDTAIDLLPRMQATYIDALNSMGNLNKFVSSPNQVAKLNSSIPAYAVDIPLPEELRRRT